MVTSCCNARMDIADTRRKNLQRLVQAEGLSVVAKKSGKPDRQIKDMLAGRKSFGEKAERAADAEIPKYIIDNLRAAEAEWRDGVK